MAYWDNYFRDRLIRPKQIDEVPSSNLSIVITIPSYNEPNTIATLESIMECFAPKGIIEVIVLFNHSTDASDEIYAFNAKQYTETQKFVSSTSWHNWLQVYILKAFDLAPKKAGVGTARKILMDEAAQRFIDIKKDSGIIVGLDADTIVAQNYLEEVENYFEINDQINSCSIHFEHRLNDLSLEEQAAIKAYEAHLRYYIGVQRWASFPFAFQTIGSAMAVRCKDYIIHGGMNRRKAGEDFYFLQKFIELGRFGELNSTAVYPSGRISDRVPFGTGKAVGEIVNSNLPFTTYNIQSFQDLKKLFAVVPNFYKTNFNQTKYEAIMNEQPDAVVSFFKTQNAYKEIHSILKNVSTESAFVKRFFRWFNAFKLMKFLHYARDNYHPNREVSEMSEALEKLQKKTQH